MGFVNQLIIGGHHIVVCWFGSQSWDQVQRERGSTDSFPRVSGNAQHDFLAIFGPDSSHPNVRTSLYTHTFMLRLKISVPDQGLKPTGQQPTRRWCDPWGFARDCLFQGGYTCQLSLENAKYSFETTLSFIHICFFDGCNCIIVCSCLLSSWVHIPSHG